MKKPKTKKKLPISGSEPIFNTRPWGKYVGSNNCYAYAMGDFRKFRLEKSIPGVAARMGYPTTDFTHCGNLGKRVVSDNPAKVKLMGPKQKGKKCPPGYYKVMMFISPPSRVTHGDFHFYKQHSWVRYVSKLGDSIESIRKFFEIPRSRIIRALGDKKLVRGTPLLFKANVWSHKRGWGTTALLKDSCNKTIKNPKRACKNYGSVNYSKHCSTFCVKGDGTLKTGKNGKFY